MSQSAIPAAAGHSQATGGATNEACLGTLLEAEQALIRKLAFVAQCRREAGRTEIFA